MTRRDHAAAAPEPDGTPLVPPPRSRLRVAVGGAVVLVIVGVAAAVLAGMLAPRGATAIVGDGSGVAAAGGGAAAIEPPILVHVLGAVEDPGLYELAAGARVVDALAAAGGFSAEADRAGINLARVLVDAEQVVVPAVGAAGAPAVDDGLVNLNTADATELETLPRVGPALADRIIAWREANGGFRSVEDLLAVTGIGEKTFEGLRALVTV